MLITPHSLLTLPPTASPLAPFTRTSLKNIIHLSGLSRATCLRALAQLKTADLIVLARKNPAPNPPPGASQ